MPTANQPRVNSGLSISDMFSIVHSSLTRGTKLLAVIKAYLDESADGRMERVFAIGGWIGTEEEWRLLELQWMSATADLKMPFHMTVPAGAPPIPTATGTGCSRRRLLRAP